MAISPVFSEPVSPSHSDVEQGSDIAPIDDRGRVRGVLWRGAGVAWNMRPDPEWDEPRHDRRSVTGAVCWLAATCTECGALIEGGTCWNCGARRVEDVT